MPNYVKNILVIGGHEMHVKSLLNSVKSEDNGFDFDKIIPMPKELEGTRSPSQIVSQREYDKWVKEQERRKDDNEQYFDTGRPLTITMQKDLIQRFGFDNWYDWCINKWGTKWGSLDVEVGDPEPAEEKNHIRVTIIFDTAWSSGHQVIAFLAEQFPTISFHLTYADEDCGSNVGIFEWKNGFPTIQNQPKDGSNEAMEIYFECWNDRENWEMKDGKWEYIDY